MGKRQPSHSITPDGSHAAFFCKLRSSRALLPFLFLAAFVLAFLWLWWFCKSDPSVSFLENGGSADWIVYPKPPSAEGHFSAPLTTVFRRTWQIARPPSAASLICKTFRAGSIEINGQLLQSTSVQQHGHWKRGFSCEIARFLKAGENVISVQVSNRSGPPALWLVIDAVEFSVHTDPQWRCSLLGASWENAIAASVTPAIRPGNPLYDRATIADSLRRQWPAALAILILSAGLVCAACIVRRSQWRIVTFAIHYQKVLVPGALMTAWIVLMLHNLPQLPGTLGFDQAGHLEYVRSILQNKSLPLADDGWQMYQPPLYYLLSAALIGPVARWVSGDTCILALRSFSALTGFLHLLLIYLCLRRLYPNRTQVQAAALAFAAMLPANVCLSHYVTNEPLAALFVTASFYFALRASDPALRHTLMVLASGISLGLALLTKFSALLAIPFVLTILIAFSRSERAVQNQTADSSQNEARGKVHSPYWLQSSLVFLVSMLAVCGWHYARVWHHFGKPLVGNWDPTLSKSWWQEPGYRAAAWYTHFGESLKRPLFSAFSSFCDGLYSTLWGDGLCSGSGDVRLGAPWNYDLLNLAYLFALPITVSLLIGCGVLSLSADHMKNRHRLLLFGFLLAMGFGLTLMTLRVPSYAQGKAFYALPALLSLSVIAAAGWDFLASRGRLARMVCQFVVLAWAITVYCSFWVQPSASRTWLVRGSGLASQGRHAEAVDAFSNSLNQQLDSVRAHTGLADALDRSGQRDEGRRQAMETLAGWSNDSDAQVQAATSLMADGRFADAAALLRHVVSSAPDHPKAHEFLGACLFEMKDYPNAVFTLQEALRVNPFSPQIHYAIAAAASEAGDPTNSAIHLHYFETLSHR